MILKSIVQTFPSTRLRERQQGVLDENHKGKVDVSASISAITPFTPQQEKWQES